MVIIKWLYRLVDSSTQLNPDPYGVLQFQYNTRYSIPILIQCTKVTVLFFDLYILEPKLDFVCDFCMGTKCLNEWVRLVCMYFVLQISVLNAPCYRGLSGK